LRLRPIRPEDAAALTQLYDRLSSESVYQRFFTVMRRLPPDLSIQRMLRLIGRLGRMIERSRPLLERVSPTYTTGTSTSWRATGRSGGPSTHRTTGSS